MHGVALKLSSEFICPPATAVLRMRDWYALVTLARRWLFCFFFLRVLARYVRIWFQYFAFLIKGHRPFCFVSSPLMVLGFLTSYNGVMGHNMVIMGHNMVIMGHNMVIMGHNMVMMGHNMVIMGRNIVIMENRSIIEAKM
jgi:hypothetical protein